MSPISDLRKRFRVYLAHEFIGKKARLSRDSVLEFWSSEASCLERDTLSWISAFKKAVLTNCVIRKQKGYIYMGGKNNEKCYDSKDYYKSLLCQHPTV